MATQEEAIEKQLWKNIDAAEYKHIALRLISLKYISDAFEELYEKLQQGEGEYSGEEPFFEASKGSTQRHGETGQ